MTSNLSVAKNLSKMLFDETQSKPQKIKYCVETIMKETQKETLNFTEAIPEDNSQEKKRMYYCFHYFSLSYVANS